MMTTMNDPAGESPPRTPRPPSSLRLLLLVLEGYAYIALVVATLIGVPALLVLGLLSRRPFVALIAVLIGVPMLLVVRTAVRALFFRHSGARWAFRSLRPMLRCCTPRWTRFARRWGRRPFTRS